MIIGISGKAGSGKDTIGEYLVSKHYFYKEAFAGRLKRAAQVIFGLTHEQCWGAEKEVVDPYWGVAPRVILQKLGTDCLRDGYAEDVWVRALMRSLRAGGSYVITDVRFANEAQAIKDAGGVVWRVERPGASARNGVPDHPSETALDGYAFDAVITNAGTIEDLHAMVDITLTAMKQVTV